MIKINGQYNLSILWNFSFHEFKGSIPWRSVSTHAYDSLDGKKLYFTYVDVKSPGLRKYNNLMKKTWIRLGENESRPIVFYLAMRLLNTTEGLFLSNQAFIPL